MKLIHISIWYGLVDEPVEYAWFDEGLDWYFEAINYHKKEISTLYSEEALKLAVF